MDDLFGPDFHLNFDPLPNFAASGMEDPSDFSEFLNFDDDPVVPTVSEFFEDAFGNHAADIVMADLDAQIALNEAGITTNSNIATTGTPTQRPEINSTASLTAIQSIQLPPS